MELVQEVYEKLKEENLDWPEHALIVVKDTNGEIKFSSVSEDDVVLSPTGYYMRGVTSLFNTKVYPEVKLSYGEPDHPEIVTRNEYENYYFARESK